MSPLSRRNALRMAGLSLAAALAGCSFGPWFGNDPRYSLRSSPSGGTTLEDLLAWEPSGGQLHLQAYAEELSAELFETGTLTTESQPIGPYEPDDEDDPPPAFAAHEGAYYRVRVTDVEAVSVDRWEFWLEPVEAAPDGVEPVAEPAEELSGLDARVFERARGDAIRAILDDRDLAAAPHGARGVVYFEPMGPDDSDLVPDPPFEYVRVDPDTGLLDDEQTLRAHAEIGTVGTHRYVHEIERVADSEAELADVLAGHVDARFDRDEDDEITGIVAEVSRGESYTERGSISERFERLLGRLGIDDPAPPEESGGTRTWRRVYEFGGSYYRATVRIRND